MAAATKQVNISHAISRVSLAWNCVLPDAKCKAVLAFCATRCNDKSPNKTFVGVDTIAQQTILSHASVSRSLKTLIRLGFISRQLRAGGYRASRHTIIHWDVVAKNQFAPLHPIGEEDEAPASNIVEVSVSANSVDADDTDVLDLAPHAPAKSAPVTPAAPKATAFRPAPSPIEVFVADLKKAHPKHPSFTPRDHSAVVIRTLRECAEKNARSEEEIVSQCEASLAHPVVGPQVRSSGNIGGYLASTVTNYLAEQDAETDDEADVKTDDYDPHWQPTLGPDDYIESDERPVREESYRW